MSDRVEVSQITVCSNVILVLSAPGCDSHDVDNGRIRLQHYYLMFTNKFMIKETGEDDYQLLVSI